MAEVHLCWSAQVGAAETLACLGSMGEEANAAIREAGGVEKLKELCSAASVAPAAVKQAARNSLAKMGATQHNKCRLCLHWCHHCQGLAQACKLVDL